MHVKSVQIRNFRLLADATVSLTDPEGDPKNAATVIVGRNNSGKTSFTEIFRRFGKGGGMRLEDFSSAAYDHFCEAYELFVADPENQEPARERLPFIELRITVSYDAEQASYGPLAEFIVDLDESADEAIVVARFQLKKGRLAELFADVDASETLSDESKPRFLASIREPIGRLYERTLHAEDPADPENTRELPWAAFDRLIMTSFISAQRGLDDVTDRESDVLATLLERLFDAAVKPSAATNQQETAAALQDAVRDVQATLDGRFREDLETLLPTFEQFGYPGLNGPRLRTEVTLAVERLLRSNTKVRYDGHLGVALPESYNGLGSRNLISILLQLLAFFRTFRSRGPEPGMHLIFIEEPEAHLHPQMQEVFIRQLNRLARPFLGPDEPEADWPAQFIVSTHSSHVANEAPFTAVRYFLAAAEDETPAVRGTEVRDLGKSPGPDAEFLHKYLTLTRCDLFFADVAILVEGTSERLMLPAMIAKLEKGVPGAALSSQYVSLLEVGGAYAHRFNELLDFLELPALVITDLDALDDGDGGKPKRCAVSRGVTTSNAAIRDWFDDPAISPAALTAADEASKIKDRRRIAYQVPEDASGPCGRTFEDAFILANRHLFDDLEGTTNLELEESARNLAGKAAKSDFALKFAIESTEWEIPRYIREGLTWLLRFGNGDASAVADAPPAPTPGKTAVTS